MIQFSTIPVAAVSPATPLNGVPASAMIVDGTLAFADLFAEADVHSAPQPTGKSPSADEDDLATAPAPPSLSLWQLPLPAPTAPTSPLVVAAEDPVTDANLATVVVPPATSALRPTIATGPEPVVAQPDLLPDATADLPPTEPAFASSPSATCQAAQVDVAEPVIAAALSGPRLSGQSAPFNPDTQTLLQDAPDPYLSAAQSAPSSPTLPAPIPPQNATTTPNPAHAPTDRFSKPRRSESPAERAFMANTAPPPPQQAPPLQSPPPALELGTLHTPDPAADPEPILKPTESDLRHSSRPSVDSPTPSLTVQSPTIPALPATNAEPRAPSPDKPPISATSAASATSLPTADPAQPAIPVTQWGIDSASQTQTTDLQPVADPTQTAIPVIDTAAPTPTFVPPPLAQISVIPAALLPNPAPAPLAPTLAKIAHDTKTGAVELSLAPVELGRLHMAITHDGDQVRVTLSAERPETLDLLRRNADQLTQEFRQAGFAGSSLSFGQWGSGNNPPQQPAPESYAAIAPEPTFPTSAKAPPTNPILGGSGLDLRL